MILDLDAMENRARTECDDQLAKADILALIAKVRRLQKEIAKPADLLCSAEYTLRNERERFQAEIEGVRAETVEEAVAAIQKHRSHAVNSFRGDTWNAAIQEVTLAIRSLSAPQAQGGEG